MRTSRPATFEEFQAFLAALLDVDVSRVTSDACFVTDLGVDSLRLLKVLLGLEERGVCLPFERLMRIQTVGEAWEAVREGTLGAR